ncbi:MAG: diacylglycerol/lipid kinase family protein [Bacteroidia bacterium]
MCKIFILRKVFLLANPVAGNGKTAKFLPLVESRLIAEGIEYQLFLTTHDQFADKIISSNLNSSFTDLWVVGGDGTFHEALNGLSDYNLTVAVIQTGTGNDFIKAIGKNYTPKIMLEKAIFAKPKLIDIGVCNGKLFHNGIGIGFDGAVAHRAAELKTETSGSVLSYYRAIAEGIFNYKGFNMTIKSDGNSAVANSFMLTVGNGIAFGGGMKVTPKAKIDDGVFDVCHVEKVSVAGRVWRLPFLVAGKHTALPKVKYFSAKELKISSDQQLTAHVDGEIFKSKEFDIKMADFKLLLRC